MLHATVNFRAFSLLVLLIIVGVANASQQLTYPWKNQSWVSSNPNILSYGGEYWWNLPEFDRTLASMQPNPFDLIHTSVAIPSGVAKSINQMSLSSSGNLTLASKYEYYCVLDLLAGLGAFPLFPSNVFVAAFSSNSNCVAYKSAWKSAVSNSLDAVDVSVRYADSRFQAVNSSYTKLLFSGICDKTYSGPGSENCAELSSALAAGGGYGKLALVHTYHSTLAKRLLDPSPDLSSIGTILALVWSDDGIIATLDRLEYLENTSLASAGAEYAYRVKSSESHKSSADSALSKLSNEKLWKITSSPKTNGIQHSGSVAERTLSLSKSKTELDQEFTAAKLEYLNEGKRGYLSNSLELLYGVDSGYSQLFDDGQVLLDDAVSTVSSEHDDAANEIATTNSRMGRTVAGNEARLLYDKATVAFADGDGLLVLGDRFERYHKAASFARAARVAGSYENDSVAKTSIATLNSLVQRAEADGIDVTSEKESLSLLQHYATTSAYGELEADVANSLVESIVLKARAKYGYLFAAKRSSIIQRLLLAGSGAADLYTDLNRYEFGLVNDGSGTILFPEAIGSLRKLNDNYDLLSRTLDGYTKEIAGNAMATTAMPMVSNVSLDAPATISLDIVLHNPYQFNASNVAVPISTYSGVQFDYSDITLGREFVKSISQEKSNGKFDSNVLLISLYSVAPYDVKRIRLEKSDVVAHTLSRSASAEGIGNGAAHVVEQMQFLLDIPVSSSGFLLPQNVLVDGATSPPSYSVGKHTLSSDRLVDDAYDESEDGVVAYPLGTNSMVEYTITILPNMDLSLVPITIDSLNNSRISMFKLTSLGGGAIKDSSRISNTQIVAHLVGLKKNVPAIVRVSYSIDNTQAFVLGQLSMFGSTSTTYLEQAKAQASSGNYTAALELIEKHKAELKSIETKAAKQQTLLESKRQLASTELDNLKSLLGRLPASSPLSAKLSERKAVLELALQNDSKLVELDNSWLNDALQVFRKDSASEISQLKERFHNTGNQTLPGAFSEFDTIATRFDAGGGSDSVPDLANALVSAKVAVESEENSTRAKLDSLKSDFASFKQSFTPVSAHYFDEAKSAKTTTYAGDFTLVEKEVQQMLANAQAAKDERIFAMRMVELNSTKLIMIDVLDSLSKEASARISLLEVQISKLPNDSQPSVMAKLDQVKSLASSGKFIAALTGASALSKEFDAIPVQNTTGITVLGITAFALLGGVVFYLSKAPKQKTLKKLGSSVGYQDKAQIRTEKHI